MSDTSIDELDFRGWHLYGFDDLLRHHAVRLADGNAHPLQGDELRQLFGKYLVLSEPGHLTPMDRRMLDTILGREATVRNMTMWVDQLKRVIAEVMHDFKMRSNTSMIDEHAFGTELLRRHHVKTRATQQSLANVRGRNNALRSRVRELEKKIRALEKSAGTHIAGSDKDD